MLLIRPPTLLPSLVATLSLFRHARPGLADPRQLPCIERALPEGRLDPDWLRAYRACVGLPPLPNDCLPPLALQIAAAPLHMAIIGDPRFPFPALGLVHLSQAVTQYRPIPPGASLRLRAYSGDARVERRGMSFGLVTVASVDGELVWRGETRALAIDREAAGSPAASPRQMLEATAETAWCETRLRVAEATGRRYAAIAGDFNPIHQHALLARLFGFRRAIVHGTWTLAQALAASGLPGQEAFQLQAHFRRPVELPSEILVRAYGQAPSVRLEVQGVAGGPVLLDAQICPPVAANGNRGAAGAGICLGQS